MKDFFGNILKSPATPYVVIIALALAWFRWGRVPPPVYTPTTPPAAVALAPREILRIEKHYYPAPAVIEGIDKAKIVEKKPEYLTEATKLDNTAVVLAVGEVPPAHGKTIVSAVGRTDNNVFRAHLEYKTLPPPFFEWKREFRLESRFLFAGTNVIEADLIANPLRVGPVEIEVGGGIEVRRDDSNLGGRGYVGATYRF